MDLETRFGEGNYFGNQHVYETFYDGQAKEQGTQVSFYFYFHFLFQLDFYLKED